MIIRYAPMIPTLFGPGAIGSLGEQVEELGSKRPLLVCDLGVQAAGIAERAEAALKAARLDYLVFDRVVADPPSDLIDQISAVARTNGVDCVIGVGGGSSMDAAKGTSIMLGLDGRMRDYLAPPPRFFKAAVPVLLVPTTSGSGSEASNACVITDDRSGSKAPMLVNSSSAIVDPELVRTLPPTATAETGMDAFSHAAEAITGKASTPRANALGLAAIKKIVCNLPIVCQDGGDIEARTEMAYASNWAGFTTVDSPPHIGHCIADALSQAFPLPHGLPCAWATPEALKLVAPVVPDKVRLIGEAMGVTFGNACSPEEVGEQTAAAVRRLMKVVGIRTPSETGVDREKAIASANAVMALSAGCPVEITPEVAARLIAQTYDNYS